MTDPITAYHDLLASADLAEASHAMLEAQLRRRNLVFGDRPLCTVLRPRFFSAAQYRALSTQMGALMPAFGIAHTAAMEQPALRAQFRLEPWEEQLVLADPGYRSPSPHGRLDCFWDEAGDSLALTEYNAETPAGAGYNDVLAEAFAAIPVMRAFRQDWEVRPVMARTGVATVMLDAWREFSGRWTLPRVGIVDWDDVPTVSEFHIFREWFGLLGMDVEIADPRSLEYRGDRLLAPGGPIDLVYKRVLINELVEREGTNHALVRAVRDRAVCMVNPFRCKLLHKKASLAVLSDEQNAGLFSADLRQRIAAHIPWTRVVEERHTLHQGQQIDLVPFVAERKDRMVLKPNDDYGGAGVVLGWTVSAEQWQAELRKALAAPYIVQERVTIPAEPYPSWVDGKLHLAKRMLDTAPFVLQGHAIDGCLTRLSTAALLNVTAGGGSTVPVMTVEPR